MRKENTVRPQAPGHFQYGTFFFSYNELLEYHEIYINIGEKLGQHNVIWLERKRIMAWTIFGLDATGENVVLHEAFLVKLRVFVIRKCGSSRGNLDFILVWSSWP